MRIRLSQEVVVNSTLDIRAEGGPNIKKGHSGGGRVKDGGGQGGDMASLGVFPLIIGSWSKRVERGRSEAARDIKRTDRSRKFT